MANGERKRGTSRTGFTIVELVVTIAIVALISTVMALTLFGRKGEEQLRAATAQLAAVLREAESRSVAQGLGASWGVHLDTMSAGEPFYALFHSATYTPETVFSRYSLPPEIRFTAETVPPNSSRDILFSQITGETTSTSIGLYAAASPATTTLITITSSGQVAY